MSQAEVEFIKSIEEKGLFTFLVIHTKSIGIYFWKKINLNWMLWQNKLNMNTLVDSVLKQKMHDSFEIVLFSTFSEYGYIYDPFWLRVKFAEFNQISTFF